MFRCLVFVVVCQMWVDVRCVLCNVRSCLFFRVMMRVCCCSLFGVCCSLFVVRCCGLLFVACFSLVVVCFLVAVGCWFINF